MVLIIGASSFIGAYTVEKFIKEGQSVVVTGRNDKTKSFYEKMGVEFEILDITKKNDFKNIRNFNFDCVILLGGLLPANSEADLIENENVDDYFITNTIGTINVLEYCRKHNIKRVISTCSYADVFNSWKKGYAITEDEPRGYKYFGDHAAYVFSKIAANDVMEYYNQQHGMKNIVFRLPPVYGVGPHGYLKINGKLCKSGLQIFIDKATVGDPITIFGDKNLERDVVYVKDVAEAFYLASRSNKSKGLYNMTSGVAVTLEDQVKTIIDVFGQGKKSQLLYDKTIENNTPSYLFSMKKAKEDFGFVPKFADFKKMMLDYKSDLDCEKFKEIFKY